MKWADRSPEEKKALRKNQAARSAALRAERDAYEKAKSKCRSDSDQLGNAVQPGNWLCYQAKFGYTRLNGKVCRVLDWNDDGFNDRRAGRNKKIIIEIEPHLSDHPETMRCTVQGFSPIPAMMVIAEAAR